MPRGRTRDSGTMKKTYYIFAYRRGLETPEERRWREDEERQWDVKLPSPVPLLLSRPHM
jgi:hypothetical protein